MQENKKREIRISADSIRKKCTVSQYGINDLFKDCKKLGYKLLRYPLGDSADLGFTLRKDNDTVIFTNTCSRLSREIFTLAHEIGHAVLHMDINTEFIDNNITLSEQNPDEKEQEANYFAANLLMPAAEIDKFLDLEISHYNRNALSAMDIAQIMSEFNVSFDMTLNRLERLKKIDPNEKLLLSNEKNEKRVGKLLKSVGGNSQLNLSAKEIDIPFEYIDYVIYNYNHNAIPKETLERALTYYQLNLDDVGDKLVKHVEINNDDFDDDLDDLTGEPED